MNGQLSPYPLQSEYQKHFAGLYDQYDWDWFATLTFKNRIGEGYANEDWSSFCKELRHKTGHRVEFVRVTEWQKRKVPHYHSLISNVRGVDPREMQEWWYNHFGIARILPYQPKRGALYYLGKYLLKDNGKVVVSRGLYKSQSFQISHQCQRALSLFDGVLVR